MAQPETNETIFLDIDLVTAGYIRLKGWPLPERYKKFSSEEVEAMKEKVSRYMELDAADSLAAHREKIG